MKKTAIILLSILVAGMFIACNQDVTVDAQVHANIELGTFVLDGKNYATLQEAVNAKLGKGLSKALGDTDGVIYLTKNASGPGAVIDEGTVVIDFNNYTYSFTNVTGLQGGDSPKAETFGLGITNGADVTLRGLQQIDLNDTTTTDLTMVYVAGKDTKLTIEDAPKMKVEDDQYVFWAADGATLTIGSTTTTSEKTEITGKIAATGTSESKPVVSFNNDTKINASELKADAAVVVINTSEDSSIGSFVGSNDANIVVSGEGDVTVNENNSESTATYTIENTSSTTPGESSTVIVPTTEGDSRSIVPGEKVDGDSAPEEDPNPSVAMIGNTIYKSLVDAVAELEDDETIVLLKDLDFSASPYSEYKWAGSNYNPLEICKNGVTLDLNGKTISNMGNCAIVFGHILAADGRISDVSIINGTLLAGTTNNVTNSYVLAVAGADGALIQNVTTNGGINVYTGSVDVEIDNCSVNGTKYYTVCAQTGSHVTIKGSTYTKNTDSTVATKAMFWVQKAGTDSDMVTPSNPTGAFEASSITVEDGLFTVDTTNGGVFYLTSGLHPVLKGGTYNIDPAAYVAEGYKARDNGDGTWTVVEKEPVAAIGDTKYFSLNDAFDASIEGDEVVLLVDTSVDTYILIDHSVSLNLNGKTVTNNVSNNRLFRLYNSTFEIKGNNGSVIIPSTNIGSFGFVDLRGSNGSSTGSEKLIVSNAIFEGATAAGSFFAYRKDGQTVELNNVDCTATAPENPSKYVSWYVGSNCSIVNGSGYDVSLTINGGTYNYETYNDGSSPYKALDKAAYAFQAGKTSPTSTSTTKIEGATVNSNTGVLECHGKVEYKDCNFIVHGTGSSYYDSAVCASYDAVVDVYDTNYKGVYGVYVYNTGGTISIHGGSFEGSTCAVKADALSGKTSIVNIFGGEFKGSLSETPSEGGSAEIIIKGGTFDVDPSAYVASGYIAIAQGTAPETWVVSQEPMQVRITKDDNSEDPVEMTLAAFRDSVNGGNTYSGYTATLLDGVNLNGSDSNQWIPIGTEEHPFRGSFNGDKKSITNLYMNDVTNGEDYALFGVIEDASIENLTVSGNITAKKGAAGIVAKALGNTTITNVTNGVNVSAYNKAGGIICSAYPSYTYDKANNNNVNAITTDRVITLDGCVNTGNITCLGGVSNSTHMIAGAIVGYTGQFGRLVCEDCENEGTIKSVYSNPKNVSNLGSNVSSLVVGWCANNVNVDDSASENKNGCYITACTNTGTDNLITIGQSQTEETATKRSDIVVGYAAGCGGTGAKIYKVYYRLSSSEDFSVVDYATAVYPGLFSN